MADLPGRLNTDQSEFSNQHFTIQKISIITVSIFWHLMVNKIILSSDPEIQKHTSALSLCIIDIGQ